MRLLILGTMINSGVNLIFLSVMWSLYRRSRNLGWQQAAFRVERIRVRRHWRRTARPYLYRVDIDYQGSRQFVMATEEEYEELLRNRTGDVMVYVREFSNRLLSPNLEKYEFSLRAVKWGTKDKRRCLKGFLVVFLSLEAILCMVLLGG